MPVPYKLPGGVFRELVGREDGWEEPRPFKELTGGKREGTVPARVRLVEFAAPCEVDGATPVCAVLASKSGKLSLPGDSGIVSRNGVE